MDSSLSPTFCLIGSPQIQSPYRYPIRGQFFEAVLLQLCHKNDLRLKNKLVVGRSTLDQKKNPQMIAFFWSEISWWILHHLAQKTEPRRSIFKIDQPPQRKKTKKTYSGGRMNRWSNSKSRHSVHHLIQQKRFARMKRPHHGNYHHIFKFEQRLKKWSSDSIRRSSCLTFRLSSFVNNFECSWSGYTICNGPAVPKPTPKRVTRWSCKEDGRWYYNLGGSRGWSAN